MDKLPFKIGDVPIQRNFDALKKAIDALTAHLALLPAKSNGGSSTVTWPGASPNTNNTTIAHQLGTTPTDIEFANFATTNMVLQVVSADATNIVVAATTRDGTSPAASTVRSFYWRAYVA